MQNALAIARALVTLLSPLVEVVIHDLATGKISFIEGGLSNRRVGDPSLLDLSSPSALRQETARGTYHKISEQGALFKSISIPLFRGKATKALLCINFDISRFQEVHKLTQALLEMPAGDQPPSLFARDWQNDVAISIHQFVQERHWPRAGLTRSQKKEIVQHLFQQGAFQEKNAADYIARALQLGRATVFNYLRQFRGE